MWLPEPQAGTSVCGGFDGSESEDWTAIKLETREGFIFTPRYGPDRLPTIWKPKDWDGKIPRGQIHAAWAELNDRFVFKRVYCDPGFHDETSFETDIEEWDLEWGPDVFMPFPTTSKQRMFPAIRRFEADLSWITHDGCPITEAHMRNARKIMDRSGRYYTLGKPTNHQKIDSAVTSVICHEAASDARAEGWGDKVDPTVHVFRGATSSRSSSERDRLRRALAPDPIKRRGKR